MLCRCGITILLSAVCLSAPVDNENACVDKTLGVLLAGNEYSCDHLINPAKHPFLGIYGDRYNICQRKTTRCCATCEDVLADNPGASAGCVDEVEGITLADGSKDCSLLLNTDPKYNIFGIYGDRINICKSPVTQCCATCAIVRELARSTDNTDGPSSKTTKMTTQLPTQKPIETTTTGALPLIDRCSENCLWVADGRTGKCSDLIGIRLALSLCQNPENFQGCEATCTTIIQQAGITEDQPEAAPQKDTSTTTTTTATTKAAVKECRDAGFTFRGQRYENCQDLNTPWISAYSRQICDSNECCSTCKKLNKKPYSVQNSENDTGKPDRPDIQVSEMPQPLVKHMFDFFRSFQRMISDLNNFRLKTAV